MDTYGKYGWPKHTPGNRMLNEKVAHKGINFNYARSW
jgi:hypothetical protein